MFLKGLVGVDDVDLEQRSTQQGSLWSQRTEEDVCTRPQARDLGDGTEPKETSPLFPEDCRTSDFLGGSCDCPSAVSVGVWPESGTSGRGEQQRLSSGVPGSSWVGRSPDETSTPGEVGWALTPRGFARVVYPSRVRPPVAEGQSRPTSTRVGSFSFAQDRN